MEKINFRDLPPVARKMLLPLACRVRETSRNDALIRDRRAVNLFAHFGDGLDSLRETSNFDQVVTVMRARQFDRYTSVFSRHTRKVQ